MRIKSDAAPLGAFIIDADPNDPNKVIIHLHENAELIAPKPYWRYDDYTLSVLRRPDLTEDIETNYDVWLNIAKASEDTE